MFKLPLLVPYSIVAFNITAFTVVLQLDWLIFNSIIAKIIAWTLTLSAWTFAYTQRDKFFVIR